MSNSTGRTSINVTGASPAIAREQRVRNERQESLSEPGAVSFLQCQPDLRHHFVHFSVRQGALRASESQGERETLVPFGDLRATVFVKRTNLLEKVAGRLLDRSQDRTRGDGVLHDNREVALDSREAWQRLCAWRARGREQ